MDSEKPLKIFIPIYLLSLLASIASLFIFKKDIVVSDDPSQLWNVKTIQSGFLGNMGVIFTAIILATVVSFVTYVVLAYKHQSHGGEKVFMLIATLIITPITLFIGVISYSPQDVVSDNVSSFRSWSDARYGEDLKNISDEQIKELISPCNDGSSKNMCIKEVVSSQDNQKITAEHENGEIKLVKQNGANMEELVAKYPNQKIYTE